MNNPNNIPSPCRQVCVRDENDICIGCFRSVDEIRGWWKFPDDEKQRVLDRAAQRRAQKDKDNEHQHYI